MLDARSAGCGADTLLVINAEEQLVGLLTTRELFQTLMKEWVPDEATLTDRQKLEDRLFDLGRDYLATPIEAVMKSDVTTLTPKDRIPIMMARSVRSRLTPRMTTPTAMTWVTAGKSSTLRRKSARQNSD